MINASRRGSNLISHFHYEVRTSDQIINQIHEMYSFGMNQMYAPYTSKSWKLTSNNNQKSDNYHVGYVKLSSITIT